MLDVGASWIIARRDSSPHAGRRRVVDHRTSRFVTTRRWTSARRGASHVTIRHEAALDVGASWSITRIMLNICAVL
jgi:hypothetical protein